MAAVTQLGQLTISVSDLESWERFATGVLGLQAAARDVDGSLLLRMDDHHHRFRVEATGQDDVATVGWEAATTADVEDIAARLEAAGVAVRSATREEAERRHVESLIAFEDPDGHALEVFSGPELAPGAFASPKGIDAGFVADGLGLGHLVLDTADLPRAIAFYTSMLGMKESDYINIGRLKAGFLHCNPRHHSIAFFEMPRGKKRINHFMIQLANMDDVGRAYDQVLDEQIPLYLTLGKHNNDHMVSFYMGNPSEFGVEYGWGGREIDDCSWQVEHLTTGSFWGHRSARKS
jgi:2,3-dihydroxybiphenyl 1,2-dioxygenase